MGGGAKEKNAVRLVLILLEFKSTSVSTACVDKNIINKSVLRRKHPPRLKNADDVNTLDLLTSRISQFKSLKIYS